MQRLNRTFGLIARLLLILFLLVSAWHATVYGSFEAADLNAPHFVAGASTRLCYQFALGAATIIILLIWLPFSLEAKVVVPKIAALILVALILWFSAIAPERVAPAYNERTFSDIVE